MRYVAAYLLAGLASKSPTAADIEKVLSSVGIEVDKEKLQKVIAEMKGKNIEEVVNQGKEKLASMPSAGAAPAAAAAPAAGAASPKKEEKKVEKKEESEEEDDDMGFGLFD